MKIANDAIDQIQIIQKNGTNSNDGHDLIVINETAQGEIHISFSGNYVRSLKGYSTRGGKLEMHISKPLEPNQSR